jgi:hypothetical protein
MGKLAERVAMKKDEKFIDVEAAGWLEVVESGLKWIDPPPAHGCSFSTFLRR